MRMWITGAAAVCMRDIRIFPIFEGANDVLRSFVGWPNWAPSTLNLVSLVLFVGSMFLATQIGTSFINFGSDKVVQGEIHMAPGADLATTDQAAQEIEAEIQKHPAVANYQTTIGANAQGASGPFSGSVGDASSARFTVTLKRDADLRAESDWLRDLIADKQSSLKIDTFSVSQGAGGGPNNSAYSVVVSGSNYDNVLRTSEELKSKLSAIPDLVNVSSNAASAKPEIRVKVDPEKALQHGTTAAQIAGQVRGLLTSQDVTQINIGGEVYDVTAVYDKADLDDIEAIKAIRVGTANPAPRWSGGCRPR